VFKALPADNEVESSIVLVSRRREDVIDVRAFDGIESDIFPDVASKERSKRAIDIETADVSDSQCRTTRQMIFNERTAVIVARLVHYSLSMSILSANEASHFIEMIACKFTL